MQVDSRFCFLFSFLCLQFLHSSQSAGLLDGQNVHSTSNLLDEIRYLKSVIGKLEEKYDTLSGKVDAQVNASPTNTFSARTCHELMSSDSTLESGLYLIDPDGWNTGDSPISVYCDKATGETRILHDSLQRANVDQCYVPGCYSKLVNYNATLRQMRALIELSPTCEQLIRYDCLNSVFVSNGVQYCWWNDRRGQPQYYWAGNDNTAHTCACGIDGTCVEPSVRCQCDAAATVALYDEGYINNKDHLPVTRLNFGRTSTTYSVSEHTLGPLRCSGSYQSTSSIPGSCADLWRSGESVSGLYQIRAIDGTIVTVFCDMTKLPEEDGYQTLIGISDVKSAPVYFTVVQENFNVLSTPGTITYEKVLLNIGSAMDIASGVFTAPKHGIYSFVFSACTGPGGWGQGSVTSSAGHRVVNEISAHDTGHWGVGSAHMTIELNAGDTVYTLLENGYFVGNEGHQIHFIGYLLQEL